MNKIFFENFFKFLFVLETKLEMIGTLFHAVNRRSTAINVEYFKVFEIQKTWSKIIFKLSKPSCRAATQVE